MTPEIIFPAFVGAVTGVVTVVTGSLVQIVTYFVKRHDERQRFVRELAVRIAMEQWRYEAKRYDDSRGPNEIMNGANKTPLPRPLKEIMAEMIQLSEETQKASRKG